MLRHRILDFLPDRVGTRAIDLYWRRLEPEIASLPLVIQPGSVAIDVGAWRGPYTRAMARVAGHVHAFEPQPRLARVLRVTSPPNVTVHAVALSDGPPRRACLWMPGGEAGLDALATLRDGRTSREVQREGRVEEIEVEAVPLDSVGIDRVGFIKIDVEGHELAVLAGAEATIAESRPRLLVEIEQRHLSCPVDEVFGWFDERGYIAWFLRGPRWMPLQDFDLAQDQLALAENPRAGGYVNNFLFTEPDFRW